MNQNASPQTAAKPLGIILVGIYTGISVLLSVLTGVGIMAVSIAAKPRVETAPSFLTGFGIMDVRGAASNEWAPILGFAMFLTGVVACAATYGLWALVSWGHSLGRVIYLVSIPLGLISLLADRTTGNVIVQVVSIALDVWILLYLAKPEVKGRFRAS